jgi:hypothetical protein
VAFTAAVALPPLFLIGVALPAVFRALNMTGNSRAHIAGIAAVCVLTWPWAAWAYSRIYVRPFRCAMRDVGHDVCVEFGYTRKGLRPGVMCPECGAGEPQA